ncbi:Hypothetical protein LUCI_2603 [Lucifera butyrica]|uniref:Uncharacterized protein n=1 Tax=Lucifera butyrica TaxID=1351585 RepID=A0A498R843_9FIRM|nr:Hypothetical protein LUCI_2603 [Lucifera butyrica]
MNIKSTKPCSQSNCDGIMVKVPDFASITDHFKWVCKKCNHTEGGAKTENQTNNKNNV